MTKSTQRRTTRSGPYECRWTKLPVTLDGRLSEPAWQQARLLKDFTIAGTRKPATTATVARLLWDDTHLYFGAKMEDQDVYALHEGHDSPFGGDDVIELFLKPSRTLPYYWEIHVTPNGATRDYFFARRNAGPAERWQSHHTGMKAAATVDGTLNHWEDRDRGWSAEAAIPWSAFQKWGGKPKPDDRWTFMVSRYDYSVHLEPGVELSASCVLPAVNYHLFEHYQELVFVR
jgi:hypothetical protein